MEIQGYRVEWEDSSPEMYPVEDYRSRPPQFGDEVMALVAAVDANAEIEQLRARVAELEARNQELVASRNWHIKEYNQIKVGFGALLRQIGPRVLITDAEIVCVSSDDTIESERRPDGVLFTFRQAIDSARGK